MKIDLFKFEISIYNKVRMIQIKFIEANEAYKVRHPILRKGMPLESCYFDGDHLDSTFHIGIYIENKIVGVSTFLKSKNELFEESNQYQLRGMAILEKHQGNSYGHNIIEYAETFLKNNNTSLLWCNARETAYNFYKKNNFKIIGEPFNIETVGLHFVMYKQL